jgi:lysophospholipase L1-like esterase
MVFSVPETDSAMRPTLHPKTALLALLLFAGAGMPAQQADAPQPFKAPRWVASWAAAPCAPAEEEPRHDQFLLRNETVRNIVHLTAGGLAIRVRLSNTFGTEPLLIDSVRVAPALANGAIDPSSSVALTVAGKSPIIVPPGKSVTTDAGNLPTAAGTDVAVSFYVSGKFTAPAIHYMALQTSYTANGDQTQAATMSAADKTTLRLVLTGVDVATRTSPYSIVAIGSSTTDGAHSTPNTNRRWPDDLFRRLQAAAGEAAPAVVNVGIAGNRVLHPGHGDWGPVWGDSAIARFNRDVLAQAGVKYVIAFEGGNDLRPSNLPPGETVTAQQMIAAFQLMAKATHDRGAKFLAGTITPAEQSDKNHPDSALWEKSRQAFNAWVLSTHDIDGAVDLAASIADPSHPSRILAKYDSGDHLHPNDAGYQAMADSIDLSLFAIAKP